MQSDAAVGLGGESNQPCPSLRKPAAVWFTVMVRLETRRCVRRFASDPFTVMMSYTLIANLQAVEAVFPLPSSTYLPLEPTNCGESQGQALLCCGGCEANNSQHSAASPASRILGILLCMNPRCLAGELKEYCKRVSHRFFSRGYPYTL